MDIPQTRQRLGCAAVRRFDDGSDFYTLPMLRDAATGGVIGDSFEIAVYLEERFPNAGAGSLFPEPDATSADAAAAAAAAAAPPPCWRDYVSPHKDIAFLVPLSPAAESGAHADYARFNQSVDATFTAYVTLVAHNMPFNPSTAEATRAMFAKRARLQSWDDVKVEGVARVAMRSAFKDGLASLAALFEGAPIGPFLEGARATYADCIIGGWLAMMAATMPADEWADFKTWHGGVFGRLHDALQQYFVCK